MRKKYDAPVLLGIERDKNGYLAVWCPHCVEFHLHGREDGHVVAHCIDLESPYIATGYYIKLAKHKGKKVVFEDKK